MISIPMNADNRALAAAVNGRIRSDGIMLAARAALWRLGGVGVLLLLAGVGTGAALYGYSYVHDSRTSFEQMASAFAAALDHANLGQVKLDIPDPVLRLETGATVSLDPAATVHLDPQARVAIANPDLQRPSERQLGQRPGGSSAIKPVTDYTIFKTVSFGAGIVQTGWKFQSSEQDQPTEQFCHYRQAARDDDGAGTIVTIAENGHLIPNSLGRHFNLDARLVAASCVWFDGNATTL